MKLCIATAYDDAYQQIGAICEATIQKYATTFGYDYRVYRERLCDRPPTWDKIKIVQRLFDEGYDYVLWMDADSLFVRFDRDIRQEIEPDRYFYLTMLIQRYIEMPGVRLDIDFPSFGFFLIRNTPWSKDLLDQLWNNTKFIDQMPSDNAALLEILGYTYYLNRAVKNTFPYAAWQHVKVLDSGWHAVKGLPYVPMAPDPFIIHYPAQSMPQRQLSMQRDYDRLVQKKLLVPSAQIDYEFSEPIDGDGWHQPETTSDGLAFRWTGSPVTTMRVPLASGVDYKISFRALYVLVPDTWQMFSLRANDMRIPLQRASATVGFTYTGMIPGTAITPGEWTTLRFCVDQTRTPGEFVETTPDSRQLGVALARLKIAQSARPPGRIQRRFSRRR